MFLLQNFQTGNRRMKNIGDEFVRMYWYDFIKRNDIFSPSQSEFYIVSERFPSKLFTWEIST